MLNECWASFMLETIGKMATYKVVIFDLDGTLTDPKIGITKSVQYALSKFNILEGNLDNLEPFIGPPLLESFQRYYSFEESKARQDVEFYRKYFLEFGIYENVVYPGIPDLLMQLHSKKKLIVATSKPTLFAEKILKHFEIHTYFTLIVGSNLDGIQSLKAEIIQHVLSELQDVPKQNLIMVGDREHDIIGAQENGIHSIAVTYGYGSVEELQKANPTYLANSVEDLKVLINGYK